MKQVYELTHAIILDSLVVVYILFMVMVKEVKNMLSVR
jgi:hypothetical protein